ncbi:restriction endonuclease subunit S [Enterobacter hormaechei]|uniref:restriction endonuclease subunit S n=1 Tax=Enterobacteriaceae TaxID=543 RepID=UPI000DE68DEE|nr:MULTISPECIES: restriction endonuclease subunit S [Enterobacteriaceae]MEB5683548.1 restriction endonuclease subunit S [Enterobacter hormaechei]SSG75910.1 type I restriction-modification system [Klebsiella pneumoniae]HAS1729672.1 restriction endonuclease subunit S [Enterobacter cloacae]HAV2099389.1 restriction endonuclease subunit S [Enterobacter cloacae]
MNSVNMPKEWCLTKLGNIVELKYGKSLPASQRDDGKFPVYGSNGIVGGHSKPLVKAEGIIVGRKGSHGKVQLSETPFYPIDTTYYVDELFNQPLKYWFYQLKNLPLTELNRSTAIPGLNREDAYNLTIALPPLAEQIIIADILDALLGQVETTKTRLGRTHSILQTFHQSVLTAAVSGKLTENWRRENDISIEDWLSTNIGSLAEVATGKTPKRTKPEYWVGGTVPWLTSAATSSTFINEAEQYVTELAVKECSLKKFPIGTLLLAMYGEGKTRGQVTELQLEATCNQACAAILVDETKISKEFLKICLLESYEETRKAAAGGAQPNLNLNKVRAIQIKLPSRAEQSLIVRRVKDLLEFTNGIEKIIEDVIERINNLTQFILKKAFSGELTTEWRTANSELINGANSAEALLNKIKDEREAINKEPTPTRSEVKKKTGNRMSNQVIKVVEALKQAGEPLSGQELLAAAGYPSDSCTAQLEQFFLDIRKALTIEKSIVRLERDDDGQDWFALAETTSNK